MVLEYSCGNFETYDYEVGFSYAVKDIKDEKEKILKVVNELKEDDEFAKEFEVWLQDISDFEQYVDWYVTTAKAESFFVELSDFDFDILNKAIEGSSFLINAFYDCFESEAEEQERQANEWQEEQCWY